MLLPEQEELLAKLVDAARTVPRPQQQFVMYSVGPAMGQTGTTDVIMGDAIQGELPVLQNDVQALITAGLLDVGTEVWGDPTVPFTVSARGFEYYEGLRIRSPDPGVAIEEEVRRYLDETFKDRFPVAHEKLRAAEEMLWQAEPSDDFTTIGHKLREALQQFATTLIERNHVSGADPDPARTKNRLRSVVESQRERLGDTKAGLLLALADDLDALNALIQRQEHGDQLVESALTWEDARAAVFNTALLMHEYDRLLNGS
jgi:hypothetical protein